MASDTAGQPLTEWSCDTCGGPVTDPDGALVVWRETRERTFRDFRIVHKSPSPAPGSGCAPSARSGYACSLELGQFLGADGLTMLLSWLSTGPLISGDPQIAPGDLGAFVDLVRRVQVPYYEEGRRRFGGSDVREYVAGSNRMSPYATGTLQVIAGMPLPG